VVNFFDQRFIITGGNGFLGARIVKRLHDCGAVDIRVPCNTTRGFLYVDDCAEGILVIACHYLSAEPMVSQESQRTGLAACKLFNQLVILGADALAREMCLHIAPSVFAIGFELCLVCIGMTNSCFHCGGIIRRNS